MNVLLLSIILIHIFCALVFGGDEDKTLGDDYIFEYFADWVSGSPTPVPISTENSNPSPGPSPDPTFEIYPTTESPTLYPTPIPTEKDMSADIPTSFPTFSPTPFVQNPGYVAAVPKNDASTPSPTTFDLNPGFNTEMPTLEPTPVEWRFARPTPFFMNPKFVTPLPSSYPTFHPTPFEKNPLFKSSEPTESPTVDPTFFPTHWPTPATGFYKNCDSINQNNNYQDKVYPYQISASGLQGLHLYYYGEYKFVTVMNANRELITYILYLCNYPSQEIIEKLGHIHVKKIIQIPVESVAFTETLVSHALELLDLKSVIKASGIPLQWNSSPCLNTLANNGEIKEAYEWDNAKPDSDTLKSVGVGLTFATQDEVDANIYNGIAVPSSWYNSTALQSSISLLSFLSVFFNQEEIATNYIKNMKTNYRCSNYFAKQHTNIASLKKVLWCDYGGKHVTADGKQYVEEDIWACKTCPGPECSLVKDAGGKLLDYTDFGDSTINVNGVEYLESTEFMEMAVFADIWISHDISSNTEPTDFNDTITYLLEEQKSSNQVNSLPLAEVPAVKYKKVYDMNLRGYYASRQEIYIEPDAILQDIFSVLGSSNHERIWLRNVFTEDIGSVSLSTCSGNPWTSISSLAQQCATLSSTPFPTTYPTKKPVGPSSYPSSSSAAGDNSNSGKDSSGSNGNSNSVSSSGTTSGSTAKRGSSVAMVVIVLMSIVVLVGALTYLGKILSERRNKNIYNVAVNNALGEDAKLMDTSTNKKSFSTRGRQKYAQAPLDSEHGVESSAHGGVVTKTVTPLSSMLGAPEPPSRNQPDSIPSSRPATGKAGWRFSKFG